MIRFLLLPMIGSVLTNMFQMEQFLQKTNDINWTVVRPPGLKNQPASSKWYRIVIFKQYFTQRGRTAGACDLKPQSIVCHRAYEYMLLPLNMSFAYNQVLWTLSNADFFLSAFSAQEILTHEGYYVPDSSGNPAGGAVARGDVARYMLSLLNTNTWTKKGVAITTKWDSQ